VPVTPRKRAPLKSVPAKVAPKPPPAPDLRGAVADSLKAMPWLAGSDDGIRALALRLAEQIEEAAERAEELSDLIGELGGDKDLFRRLQRLEAMCDVTKLVGWLGPQLQGVLRDLGGTPAARAAMQKDKPVGGRLAQLRDAAGRAEKR
jgi:hypothetical protein